MTSMTPGLARLEHRPPPEHRVTPPEKVGCRAQIGCVVAMVGSGWAVGMLAGGLYGSNAGTIALVGSYLVDMLHFTLVVAGFDVRRPTVIVAAGAVVAGALGGVAFLASGDPPWGWGALASSAVAGFGAYLISPWGVFRRPRGEVRATYQDPVQETGLAARVRRWARRQPARTARPSVPPTPPALSEPVASDDAVTSSQLLEVARWAAYGGWLSNLWDAAGLPPKKQWREEHPALMTFLLFVVGGGVLLVRCS